MTCSACNEGFLFDGNTTCLPGCADGKYLDNGKCPTCPVQCTTCSNADQCNSCATGYFLNGKLCVKECPLGLFANNQKNTCDKCESTCASCNSASGCLTCQPALLTFQNTQCVQSCPNAYYKDGTQCKQCDASCADCMSADACTACPSGAFLLESKCVAQCPKG